MEQQPVRFEGHPSALPLRVFANSVFHGIMRDQDDVGILPIPLTLAHHTTMQRSGRW